MSAADAGEGPHWRWDGADLLLDLHGKPGARRDAFGTVVQGRLNVQIAAVAEGGKATAHLRAFVAKAFGVSKSAVAVVYGEASVNKRLRIAAPRTLPLEAQVPPRDASVAEVPGADLRPRRS